MLKIEIWSDINCPFCYIGKRHLEEALKTYSGNYQVEWKSFELDPYARPVKGMSQNELLAKKYGKTLEWAQDMNAQMTARAKEVGLNFHMDKVVPANSFNAHRLIHLAKNFGKQDQMKERFLNAHFTEGLDLNDLMVLENLAVEVGLPKAEVQSLLNSHQFSEDVRSDEEIAAELGIRGVPFFVFNKKLAVSGAQPVEVFKEIISKEG